MTINLTKREFIGLANKTDSDRYCGFSFFEKKRML